MYFSATIFSLVGFTSPILTSLTVSFTNFLFTLLAFHTIDRIGRRRILLYSIPFMVAGLAICSFAFQFIALPKTTEPQPSVNPLYSARDRYRQVDSKFWPLVILASTTLYVSSYAVGLGCVPWQQGELFPLPVRSLGSGLATATNWGSNTLVGLTFLPMMEALSPTWTFATYAAVCCVGYVIVWRIYPETAGLSLENVGALLRDGWGVGGRERARRRSVER
jgi:MFS transporter, SP family, solute carrier family 2 (myo-inositol transporter), member 13